MTIEHAVVQIRCKPWGSNELRPWSDAATNDGPVGELWFQRPDVAPMDATLLFKLAFTTEPLSIQVHPDDAFARSIGLANGKTEAWYILSAAPGARVAVGLQYPLSSKEFRTAIADGSIANIVRWNQVRKGDVIFVPAGTIHAIGADIVLAEIQQRSDATFRLFDYGRQRDASTDSVPSRARSNGMRSVIDAELCKRHGPSPIVGVRSRRDSWRSAALATTTRLRCLSGASRPAFSAAAVSPLDNDCAGNHQTEENRHHYWSDDPLMQFEFLDGGHTDRPLCWREYRSLSHR